MPYMGRNFNTQTLGKDVYFVICMISRHCFRQNCFLIVPNLGGIGAKMTFLAKLQNSALNLMCGGRASKIGFRTLSQIPFEI